MFYGDVVVYRVNPESIPGPSSSVKSVSPLFLGPGANHSWWGRNLAKHYVSGQIMKSQQHKWRDAPTLVWTPAFKTSLDHQFFICSPSTITISCQIRVIKAPQKRWGFSVSPRLVLKKHPKLKCQLIFQTLGTNKTKNPHQPHHVFFSLQQKKDTGPNVSKVVVSSFFHPWPELITQNGSHQQPLNFGHFQTSQVRFSTTGTPPVEVSLRNLVV